MRAEMKSTESEFVQNLLHKPIEPSISFGQPAQADILVSIVDYEESDFERLNRLIVSMADLDIVVAVSITTSNPVGLAELLVKSGRSQIMNEGRLIIHNIPPTIKYMLDKAGDHTTGKWESESSQIKGEIERKNMLLFGYDMLMYRKLSPLFYRTFLDDSLIEKLKLIGKRRSQWMQREWLLLDIMSGEKPDYVINGIFTDDLLKFFFLGWDTKGATTGLSFIESFIYTKMCDPKGNYPIVKNPAGNYLTDDNCAKNTGLIVYDSSFDKFDKNNVVLL